MNAAFNHDCAGLQTNPLFNSNKLKLGVCCAFNGGGATMTTDAGAVRTTWPNALDVAREADRAGFEALVPCALAIVCQAGAPQLAACSRL